MVDHVDVLAYDVPAVDGDGESANRRRALTLAAWSVAAVAIGVGVFQGSVLVGAVAAFAVLGVRALAFEDGDREMRTRYRAIDAGRGSEVVRAHEMEARRRERMRTVFLGIVALSALGYGYLVNEPMLGVLAAGVVGAVGVLSGEDPAVPCVVEANIQRERAQEQFELRPNQ